jgi:phosphatidylinositol-3-phosphatase
MNAFQNRRRGMGRLATVVAAGVLSALAVMPGVAHADSPSVRPTPDKPCGVAQKTDHTKYEHVVWIVMENKSFAQVNGSPNAPYINKLAGLCGEATNYSAITHPSLPNYIAMTSGSPQGVTDDADPPAHPLNVDSIFSQFGGDWKSLTESMKTNCGQKTDGLYAPKHNPAAYYVEKNFPTLCQQKDIPFDTAASTPDLSGKFTFITPDLCNDMHNDCTGTGTNGELQTGDKYLSTLIPQLVNSTEYQSGNTAIVLTWDEGDSASNQVLTEVIAPTVTPGTKANQAFTHYSLLRTTEDMFGLPPLGEAAKAASMRDAFSI